MISVDQWNPAQMGQVCREKSECGSSPRTCPSCNGITRIDANGGQNAAPVAYATCRISRYAKTQMDLRCSHAGRSCPLCGRAAYQGICISED